MKQYKKLKTKRIRILLLIFSLVSITFLPLVMVRAERTGYNYYQPFDNNNDWVDTHGETTTVSGLLFANIIWNGLARTYHNFDSAYDSIDFVCAPICYKQDDIGHLRFILFDTLDATGKEVFKLEWSGQNRTEGRIKFWHNGSLAYNSEWLDLYKEWNGKFRITRKGSSVKLYIDGSQKWSTNDAADNSILSAAIEFTKIALYVDLIDVCIPSSVQVLNSSLITQNDNLIKSYFKFEINVSEIYKFKVEYRVHHDNWTEWYIVSNEQIYYDKGTNYQLEEDVYNINPLDTKVQVKWSIYSKGGYILIDSHTSDEYCITHAKIMDNSYLSWEADVCTSHFWFYVNISYAYYLMVQCRIKPEEGVWGDWNLLRWSGDNYSSEGTGIYYVSDTFNIEDGDTIEVNWSIHINNGNTLLDTRVEQINMNFPIVLSSSYVYKQWYGRYVYKAYSRMYFDINTANIYKFIVDWRWKGRGKGWTKWEEFTNLNGYYDVGSPYLFELYLGYFLRNEYVQCRWSIYDANGAYLFSCYPEYEF